MPGRTAPSKRNRPLGICDMTDKETIYVTDVGQHQMWAAQYLKHEKAQKTSSQAAVWEPWDSATAQQSVHRSDVLTSRVIHFTGDGSFHMNLNEACTAVSQELPIITVIMNNTVLGMVYQWQTAFLRQALRPTTPEERPTSRKAGRGIRREGFSATNRQSSKKSSRRPCRKRVRYGSTVLNLHATNEFFQ